MYTRIYLLILLIFLGGKTVKSQTLPAKQAAWADSLARSEAGAIQQQFRLSSGQADVLHQAYVQWYAARKQVIAKYWKTDSFPRMMLKADRLKDSIYLTILNQRQYHAYKDTLYRRREREQHKTSLSLKSSKP